MSGKSSEIDTEALKKEVKEELLKREIIMGLEEDEIDLFELFRVLVKRWKLIIVFPFIVAVLTALYSLTLPNYYKATSTIFVHSGKSGMSSLLNSIPLAGMLGGLGGAGGGSSDYLVAYLKSKTLSAKIINEFGVATNPSIVGKIPSKPPKYDDLLETVSKIVSVNKDKDGLISVSAETMSASLSAEIAEAYIAYLENFSKGPQKEKRAFVERQLSKVSKELEEAEKVLQDFQDKHKIFALEKQAQGVIEKLAKLESEEVTAGIFVKMQDSMLRASGNMPELVKVEAKKLAEEAKIEALKKEIASTEKVLGELPEIALQYVRLNRNLKVKEKVFGLLTEQFEMAKIAEAEEGSQFEVLDHARAPEKKSKPKRSVMVILAGLAAGVLGVFAAFVIEFINRKKAEELAAKKAKA